MIDIISITLIAVAGTIAGAVGTIIDWVRGR